MLNCAVYMVVKPICQVNCNLNLKPQRDFKESVDCLLLSGPALV